jgi:hypothetical protein
MARIWRLVGLIFVALFAGAVAIGLTFLAISQNAIKQDATAQATVVAGAITVFGIIFSAMYNEITSYYTERSTNIGKKWDFISPQLKKHYSPWLTSAKDLHSALTTAMEQNKPDDNMVERILYLTMVFYGYRLAFIMDPEAGGLLLLSTSKDQDAVEACYEGVKDSYQWAGTETAKRVSNLQEHWRNHNKPEKPYVLDVFAKDISNDKKLQESKAKLALWLTKENMKGISDALQNFTTTFKTGIDRLYTAWGD